LLALKLADVLHCRVEDLFGLPSSAGLQAVLAPGRAAPERVAVGRVGDRWVAHPIGSDRTAADGVVRARRGDVVEVDPLADVAALERNVLVAGCAPLLGALAQRAGVRLPDARLTWLHANSARALDLLGAGLLHIGGVHFADARARRRKLGALGRRLLVANLIGWRQGLVVARGNPLGIRKPADLLRPALRFAAREQGAGAHDLVRAFLRRTGDRRRGIPAGPTAGGHDDVARLVRCGAADVGVAIESVALAADLDFIPLSEERFDLIVPADLAAIPAVSRIVDLLGDRAFRTETARMPGYDSSHTGEVATIEAA
jgi:molybdate-binding protein